MAQPPSSRKSWPRRGLALVGTLSALIALGSGYAFGYLLYLQGSVDRADVELTDTVPDEPQTILILGSDSREGFEPGSSVGSPEDVEGQRADTIILMRIDPRTGKTVVLHFPRDLRVPIAPAGGAPNKINTAFEDGPQGMIDTIEDLSGLTVNHYVEVDFSGFQKIVEAMGGVRICIDRPLVDPVAELDLPEPGCYLLGGKRALAFVRARSVEGDRVPDFARISRQQQFLRAVLDRALAPGSVFKLPTIARAVLDNITVDEGLSVIEVNDLSRRMGRIGTPEVDFRVVPSVPVLIDEISYLEPTDQADDLFARLREGRSLGKLGLELGYGIQQFAQISVRVLDAGGDVATVRERLVAGGFEVRDTIQAPSGTAASGILYGAGRETGAAAVADFLANLFVFSEAPSVQPAPSGSLRGAMIGIVVGPDFPEPVVRS